MCRPDCDFSRNKQLPSLPSSLFLSSVYQRYPRSGTSTTIQTKTAPWTGEDGRRESGSLGVRAPSGVFLAAAAVSEAGWRRKVDIGLALCHVAIVCTVATELSDSHSCHALRAQATSVTLTTTTMHGSRVTGHLNRIPDLKWKSSLR